MYDVVLVGYGPVGAMFANLLGQAGHRVAVFERQPSVYHLPRAAHFDHEAMRAFQAVGLDEAILPATCGIDGMHLVNGEGEILLSFDQPPGPTPVAYANDFMFYQPELELAMRAGVERFANVDVFLRHDVIAVEQGDGSVSVRVDDLAGEGERVVSARYVIGCDGARSVVRSMAGLALEDFGFDESWLVVDLLMTQPVALPTVCQQICDPRRPTTYVPMPEPRRRFEFMLLPGEAAVDLERPDRVYELLAPWVSAEEADIERAVVYTFTAGIAPEWRSGDVFLAGDAAHLMPPFLGQGMCSGIRDATNLAWKLDLVLRDRAGDALLDTYRTERSPHVKAIIDLAVAVGRTICLLDPDEAVERDRQMIASRATGHGPGRDADTGTLLPPLGPGLHCGPSGDPEAGKLFIQPWVIDGSGEDVRLDDVLGPGFAVLVRGPVAADLPATVGVAVGVPVGVPVVVFVPGADGPGSPDGRHLGGNVGEAAEVDGSDGASRTRVVIDRDGFLDAWFTRHGVAALLLRPDRYIAASSPDLPDAATVAKLLSPLTSLGA